MEWITILKCPITGQDLRVLQPDEINTLNGKLTNGLVWQADGAPFGTPLQQGLTTIDNSYIYPIVKEIVLLLKDLAITGIKSGMIMDTISDDKKRVKNFYDLEGWHSDEAGTYKDAHIYEDLRKVSRDYLKKCHTRVSRYLNPSGKYLLDAASGAIQHEEYLSYSANYRYRVCVDFSFQALKEAKRKLGSKGACVLCDITNLPFKDGVMDGFVSLNTVHLIPKDEQVTAIKELYRVLAPDAKGVVVYDWFKHSSWMNFWLFPLRGFVYVKNRMLDGFGKLTGTRGAKRRLYFYAHPPQYFQQNLPPYQLRVWRSLSVRFMKYYVHSWLFGKQILNWVYKKEEKDPETCGLKGEYPMLVFEKK